MRLSSTFKRVTSVVPIVLLACFAAGASAQYTQITTPFHNNRDSFFERNGVGFGFDLKGAPGVPGDDGGPSGVFGFGPNNAIQFRQGGVGAALPPFGGHNPANDANLGIGINAGGNNFFLNLFGQQGSDRSSTTTAPTIVVPNGGQGTISHTIQRPFVTGLVPVVGSGGVFNGPPAFYPTAPAPVSPLAGKIEQLYQQRQQAAARGAGSGRVGPQQADLQPGPAARANPSTAEQGAMSVADIRRQQAAKEQAKDNELLAMIERARGAEAAGKTNVARIYYKMAARRAEGELRTKLLQKIEDLQ